MSKQKNSYPVDNTAGGLDSYQQDSSLARTQSKTGLYIIYNGDSIENLFK